MKAFHLLRNLIRGSYVEGALYALMVGSTESFALYFALKSGLSYSEIGLLSTLPIIFGSLSQWIIPFTVGKHNARNWKLICYGVQVIGIAMLVFASQSSHPKYWLFPALTLYWVGGMTSGPLWLEWISKEVPPKVFGIFFSKRNAFVSLVTVLAYLSTSAYLQSGQDNNRFLAAFLFGGLARFLGLVMQAWISRPSQSVTPHMSAERSFFSSAADSGSRHLNPAKIPIVEMFLFTIFFKMAANTSSPFFMSYMVQELNYSLLQYTVLTAIPFVGRFLFLANWGRNVDGMKPFLGLTVAGFGISFLPALWVTFPYFNFLLGLEVISGLMWGGFELCSLMILRMKFGQSTLRPIAMHMALMNFGALVGAKIGGYLLDSGMSFTNVFYLSTCLRFSVVAAYLARISSLPITYQGIRAYGEFISTVLSIRPSMANVGRLLWIRRRRMRRLRDYARHYEPASEQKI